jgi:asparagine N-glycosylation enzyme membrane subunit Stt3
LHLWAAYGFLPFFLILIAIIQPVYYFFVFSSTRKYFGLFIFLVVSMLFLRHPENIYLFFMLGGLVSLVSKETHQEIKAANFL